MWLLTGGRSHAQKARDRWVAGLLTPACGECPARPGEWCDDMCPPPAEMVRISRDPARFVHSTRIVAAIDGGHARKSVTITQFAGGPLSSGLAGARTRHHPGR